MYNLTSLRYWRTALSIVHPTSPNPQLKLHSHWLTASSLWRPLLYLFLWIWLFLRVSHISGWYPYYSVFRRIFFRFVVSEFHSFQACIPSCLCVLWLIHSSADLDGFFSIGTSPPLPTVMAPLPTFSMGSHVSLSPRISCFCPFCAIQCLWATQWTESTHPSVGSPGSKENSVT